MTHAFPTRRSSDLAVGAGVCEIALTNSYYYIRMANGDNAGDRKVTEHVKLGFPSLTGQGAHINISGGGVAANAPNRENAVRLLEFFASAAAQRHLAANKIGRASGRERVCTYV